MKVLSHEEDALDEPLHAEVAAIKRKYYALARKVFDGLAAAGLAPGLNPRVAVLSLFGMMNWVYKWHNPEVDPGSDESNRPHRPNFPPRRASHRSRREGHRPSSKLGCALVAQASASVKGKAAV